MNVLHINNIKTANRVAIHIGKIQAINITNVSTLITFKFYKDFILCMEQLNDESITTVKSLVMQLQHHKYMVNIY